MPERFLGRTLGKYRVDALLGSGGFAWVYKAYDPELEIPVALKVLKPQYAGDEKFETRFRREAATAAKLRHPNIIQIYSVGRDGDAVYFAMDYLPNGLADRLTVMSVLPESMLLRVGTDVASALAFAHREGVIHRDIKTDNILFDNHGNAVVADFGIARAVSGYVDQTGTNMVVGTPQYFSPEQARGQTLDGRADLYSLGVTLFKAATGTLPFTGTDWYEIARQHVEDKPPRPRSINPSLSKETEEIILRLLEKEPDDRFPNGEALCSAFIQLLASRGDTASIHTSGGAMVHTISAQLPTGAFGRTTKLKPRFLIGGGLAALLVLVSAVTLVGRKPDGSITSAGVAGVDSALAAPVATAAADSPRRSRLVKIDAPAGATLTVDGTPVGKAPWTSDTLPPGSYEVVARMPTDNGCPPSRVVKTMRVKDTGTTRLRLSPRGCGSVLIRGTPAENARYVITSMAGDETRSGSFPLSRPLLLPEGAYKLTVSRPLCADFNQEFRIQADRRNKEIAFKMLCHDGEE